MNKLQMIKKIAKLKLAKFESSNFVYNLMIAGFNQTPFKELKKTRLEGNMIIVPVLIKDENYDFLTAYFIIHEDDSFDLFVFYNSLGFRFKTTKYGNKDMSSIIRNLRFAYEELIQDFHSFYTKKFK